MKIEKKNNKYQLFFKCSICGEMKPLSKELSEEELLKFINESESSELAPLNDSLNDDDRALILCELCSDCHEKIKAGITPGPKKIEEQEEEEEIEL